MANEFIGIDVSKNTLDLAYLKDQSIEYLKYENNHSGFKEIIKFLKNSKNINIGLESTGIYHKTLANSLSEAGYNVYELNPYNVFHFKKSKKQYAKTDKLDSKLIAYYLKDNFKELVIYTPQTEEEKKIYAILIRINQLTKMKIQEINHKESAVLVDEDTQKHIDFLEKKIKQLKKKLITILNKKKNKILNDKVNVVTKVTGIGIYTAIILLVNMPELGKMNRNRTVALAGMAPFANDSGKYKGKRKIKGGRKRVRDALYMPFLAGLKNEELRAVYDRLKKRGKPHKVIRIAIMKRMLIKANTLMKEYYLY